MGELCKKPHQCDSGGHSDLGRGPQGAFQIQYLNLLFTLNIQAAPTQRVGFRPHVEVGSITKLLLGSRFNLICFTSIIISFKRCRWRRLRSSPPKPGWREREGLALAATRGERRRCRPLRGLGGAAPSEYHYNSKDKSADKYGNALLQQQQYILTVITLVVLTKEIVIQ